MDRVMPELPEIPDAGWSSLEKAFYCRSQAINLLQEAERSESPAQAEDLAGVALRWLALARFHEAESSRTLLMEEHLSEYRVGERQRAWNPGMRLHRRDLVED